MIFASTDTDTDAEKTDADNAVLCQYDEHEHDDASTAGPSKTRAKTTFINSRLVFALDRCKITDRSAVHVIVAVAESLGFCVNDLVINRTTIQRFRESNRSEIAKEVKDKFKACFVICVTINFFY